MQVRQKHCVDIVECNSGLVKPDDDSATAIEKQMLASGAYEDGSTESVGAGIRRSSPE
jgi:hypothetical protein